MQARTLILAALAAGAIAGSANARIMTSETDAAPRAPAETGLQLAQSRDVEVYIDRYGRQVLVDRRTGDVVGVLEDDDLGARREDARKRAGEARRDGRWLMGQKLRRELEVRLGLREPPPGDEAFGREPAPDEQYAPRDAFPAPPREEPRYESRGEVSRAPLEAPRQDDNSYGGEQPDDPAAQPLDENRDYGAAPDAGSDTGGEDGSIVMLPRDEQSGETAAPEEAAPQPGAPSRELAAPPAFPKGASEDVTKIQVLLDRLGLSPGVIDGRMGSNVNKALDAYKEKFGRSLHTYDKDAINAALADAGGDALTKYTITPDDVGQMYLASVPQDYGEKAKLDRLGFTSVTEMLAERFHMDEDYLKSINAGADFTRPGTIINVVSPGQVTTGKVTRIIADKGKEQVRGYDDHDRLLVAYPATIGSEDTPSPSGTVNVERVATDPQYTYNPKVNFKQGNNDGVLTIPPGPNGPVGTIWIALSKPTYGIHGTPEPSLIGKTASHGCVRLTNWDAQELAKMVEPGVTVEFVD